MPGKKHSPPNRKTPAHNNSNNNNSKSSNEKSSSASSPAPAVAAPEAISTASVTAGRSVGGGSGSGSNATAWSTPIHDNAQGVEACRKMLNSASLDPNMIPYMDHASLGSVADALLGVAAGNDGSLADPHQCRVSEETLSKLIRKVQGGKEEFTTDFLEALRASGSTAALGLGPEAEKQLWKGAAANGALRVLGSKLDLQFEGSEENVYWDACEARPMPEDLSDSLDSTSCSTTDKVDRRFLRTYDESCPLPWNTFLRLRRSWGRVELEESQEDSVRKYLETIPLGVGNIHDSVPLVSAFMDKHCPELKSVSSHVGIARPGATLLMLSVVTGNVELCLECLKLGANPNNCKFLTDVEAPDNNLRHGYSPMFMACLCEQLEIMKLLYANGGSIHIADRWGRTPLHAAAAMGSTDVVDWLVSVGAPRKVVDVSMQKPGEVCEGKVLPQLATTSVLFRPVSEKKLCHCTSQLMYGRCGCVDDMSDRWYRDRLSAPWSKTYRRVRDELIMTAPPSMAQVLKQTQQQQANAAVAQRREETSNQVRGNSPPHGGAAQQQPPASTATSQPPPSS